MGTWRRPGAGPRFTGGSLYTYPNFSGAVAEDVVKFATDYAHFISRPYGLEAVMRVRASKGTRRSRSRTSADHPVGLHRGLCGQCAMRRQVCA